LPRGVGAILLATVAWAPAAGAAIVPLPARFVEQLCLQATSTSGGWVCGSRIDGLSPVVAETVAGAHTWTVSIKGDQYTGSGTAATQGGVLPGASVSLALDPISNVGPEDSYVSTAYGIARGVAEVTYEVIVVNDVGSPVTNVPLVVVARGESRPGPLSGRAGPYGWAQAWARLTVDYPAAGGGDATLAEEAFACLFQADSPCYSNPGFDTFAVAEALPVRVGSEPGASAVVEVKVQAEAEIQGEIYVLKSLGEIVQLDAASGMTASFVDPVIRIDPSFPHAGAYHLEFSDGIEPAPEPEAGALGLVALAALAVLTPRRLAQRRREATDRSTRTRRRARVWRPDKRVSTTDRYRQDKTLRGIRPERGRMRPTLGTHVPTGPPRSHNLARSGDLRCRIAVPGAARRVAPGRRNRGGSRTCTDGSNSFRWPRWRSRSHSSHPPAKPPRRRRAARAVRATAWSPRARTSSSRSA
jgi:hypothetical protein